MEIKRLIRFDWAIKNILRNKANFSILEGFLSELLKTKVVIESLLESESNKEYKDDKNNRVDILAKLQGDGEEHVIIEVQCAPQYDFLARMLYGVSKVVVEYLKQGDRYIKIPKVISVNIVYFDLGHGEDYIYHGRSDFEGIHKHDKLLLGEKAKKHYPAHIDHVGEVYPEYYILKVEQFDLTIRDTLDEWMYALRQSEVRPEFKAQGIQEAGQTLNVLKLSEEERAAYGRFIENERNARSVIASRVDDAFEEGEAKGLAKGKAEMITNMHNAGTPMEQMCQFSGLTQEEVEKIIGFSR